MKYFKRIRANVDTVPFLAELSAHDDAWDRVTGRPPSSERRWLSHSEGCANQ